MYANQICPKQILALVSKTMFNINKIHAHIKRLKLQELKLTRYRSEEKAQPAPRAERLADIERALNRCTAAIKMWESKLTAISSAPPRPKDRGSIVGNDQGRPLIG